MANPSTDADLAVAPPGGRLAELAAACELLGDRWSLPIVASLLEGPLRYTEIQERLPALAPNILSARLRKLEQDGLLVATRYSIRPARFDYRLTTDGDALAAPIQLLSAWAAERAHHSGRHISSTSAANVRLRFLSRRAASPAGSAGRI